MDIVVLLLLFDSIFDSVNCNNFNKKEVKPWLSKKPMVFPFLYLIMAFPNCTNTLKMSIEELQMNCKSNILTTSIEEKYGVGLAQRYEPDLSAVEFCQELYVFKEQAPPLFGDIEKANAFLSLATNLCA